MDEKVFEGLNVLDRSKAKWMMVWDCPTKKLKRLVFLYVPEIRGPFFAVSEGSEWNFFNGKNFLYAKWDHAEPLSEPKKKRLDAENAVLRDDLATERQDRCCGIWCRVWSI